MKSLMNIYETNTMFNDFIHKTNGSFCQACLSVNRKLSPVGEYIDIYRSITNNIYNVDSILLCWECIAILKKIKCFKSKVEEAHRQLINHIVNKQKLFLKTLSKLSNFYIEDIIIIIHNDEDDEIKEQMVIKEEIKSDDNDDFNYDQITNEVSFEEIKKDQNPALQSDDNQLPNDLCFEENKKDKNPAELESAFLKSVKKKNQENVTDTKILIKSRNSRHYVFVSGTKKILRKKFCLKKEEAVVWWEREGNSEFYKNFKYKCKLCIHGFNCKEKLEAHVLKKHDVSLGPYICPICNIRFASEDHLNIHTPIHERAWHCTYCDFQCYTMRRLNAHIDKHKIVQCVYCKAEFLNVQLFRRHYKALHSVFICDDCGKKCRSKRAIEKHVRHHFDHHTCTTCGNRYASVTALRKHRLTKHSNISAENSYCVLCDKQFTSVELYKRHVGNSAAHNHERKIVTKKFPCPECSKTYSRRAYMMNHYRYVHVNQSKHYCQHCDRHFLNRTRFVEHMKFNHQGVKKEKNKLCNICGRGFADNRTLINHLRTHSGERPYECEYCSAKFTQKVSMVSHVKYIHMKTKRKPQWQQ